jgi:hypothetical protein
MPGGRVVKEESKAAFTRKTKGDSNRDKASLDIFWLRDESLEESANLPDPAVLAQEIVEDLGAALEQFREISVILEQPGSGIDKITDGRDFCE